MTTRIAPPRPVEQPPVAASAAASGGIVSVRLRPWLELDLVPDQLELTEAGAQLQFACVVENSGSSAAIDIRIEAALINAGERQDDEIAAFFAREPAPSAIPRIEPLSRLALKSTVDMAAAAIRGYAVEERRLFVPLILFNAHYRWSGGSGHSGGSFLLGRGGGSDGRMAPFRLDLGPRTYDGLSHRRHSAAVRR